MSALNAVDLPAPLGPMIHVTAPPRPPPSRSPLSR